MWYWRRLENIKRSEKVTNEEFLEYVYRRGGLPLNNILRREANWFGHILIRNCLLHEEQMTEVKGIGRIRTQLLDDLRNRISC